jgi:ankyrin repeat protein
VGSSALHAACAADATDIVELLLANGADPALTDQVKRLSVPRITAADTVDGREDR